MGGTIVLDSCRFSTALFDSNQFLLDHLVQRASGGSLCQRSPLLSENHLFAMSAVYVNFHFPNEINYMNIGVLKCTSEPMVAIVPKVAKKLTDQGYSLSIEKGAGTSSLFGDEAYEASGAVIKERADILRSSDLLLTVAGVDPKDLSACQPGTMLIGNFQVRSHPEVEEQMAQSQLRVFSLDKLPRSSVAQAMDVLSSLASLAGYKAVVTAAERFPGYFPMMTTAAGTIPPARVLVLGAGVAGLQAIATARRLGAVVEAFDVRSAVKEEVESLGATFIAVEGGTEDASAGGYAVTQSEAYLQQQKELIHERALKSDAVICTAQIPGRPAPKLLEARTVNEMKAGSVIVDMASASGGNCELTKDGSEVIINDVTIMGNSQLYNLLPTAASTLFSNNLFNFIKFIFKDGELSFDHEIVLDTLVGEAPVMKSVAS